MQGNYDRHSYNPYETLDDEMSLDANDPMNYDPDPDDEDLEDDVDEAYFGEVYELEDGLEDPHDYWDAQPSLY
tara:strand:+ start:1857 stop:2075 length:219 start_codon:yes stop_codon:yes gene_type:complete